MSFTGFRPEAYQFLADLAANNDRAWFEPRKADYDRLLKEPLAALCTALAERFAARGIPLHADPVRSPFRIYRDVRFSRDKRPYKTHLGASFPWAVSGETGGARARTAPGGGYFHLAPGETFVGGGMWHPDPALLAAWRAVVVSRPAEVRAALDDPAFVRTFGQVDGERLKRTPTGFDPAHPEAELLKLKDVVFGRSLSEDQACSPELPDVIADALATARPVLRLLAGLHAA